jgi:hypothetical protein
MLTSERSNDNPDYPNNETGGSTATRKDSYDVAARGHSGEFRPDAEGLSSHCLQVSHRDRSVARHPWKTAVSKVLNGFVKNPFSSPLATVRSRSVPREEMTSCVK